MKKSYMFYIYLALCMPLVFGGETSPLVDMALLKVQCERLVKEGDVRDIGSISKNLRHAIMQVSIMALENPARMSEVKSRLAELQQMNATVTSKYLAVMGEHEDIKGVTLGELSVFPMAKKSGEMPPIDFISTLDSRPGFHANTLLANRFMLNVVLPGMLKFMELGGDFKRLDRADGRYFEEVMKEHAREYRDTDLQLYFSKATLQAHYKLVIKYQNGQTDVVPDPANKGPKTVVLKPDEAQKWVGNLQDFASDRNWVVKAFSAAPFPITEPCQVQVNRDRGKILVEFMAQNLNATNQTGAPTIRSLGVVCFDEKSGEILLRIDYRPKR